MKPPAALILVLLTACAGIGGDGARPAARGPEEPVTSSPVEPGSPIPSPSPRLVEPRPGLKDVRPQPWDGVRRIGPRRLLVAFYSGVHECYGVDRVDVKYGPEELTVTLFIGRAGGTKVCIEIAEYQAVKVRLDEPIGDRDIVDGAVA